MERKGIKIMIGTDRKGKRWRSSRMTGDIYTQKQLTAKGTERKGMKWEEDKGKDNKEMKNGREE